MGQDGLEARRAQCGLRDAVCAMRFALLQNGLGRRMLPEAVAHRAKRIAHRAHLPSQ